MASQYNIPLVPYSGGTSLEGHFNAPSRVDQSAGPANSPHSKFDVNEDQLQPGHSFTVDFSRYMNKIIALHGACHQRALSVCNSSDKILILKHTS